MIFVTVGTGSFDELVRAVDDLNLESVFYQIGCGSYMPRGDFERILNQEYFNECLRSASLVITHAGAGNIFNLLEMQTRFVAVPNFLRTDEHQSDICGFIESQRFGFVCWDLRGLSGVISKSMHSDIRSYHKTPFYGYSDIFAGL